MKIAVVICEYNPLQNGHIYHLSRAKSDTGAERVVCVMSGNFTQRGECAVSDKYTRATWAVKNGVDMVVELPPQYVLTTAKYFALGGVKIANLIKGDVILSFGSELGDIKALQEIADIQEDSNFKSALKTSLDLGNGYAKSYGDAIGKVSPQFADCVCSPNNILAIEYIKALNELNSKVLPHTVKRIGGGYHDKKATELCSASAVREACEKGKLNDVRQSVPACVYDALSRSDMQKHLDVKDRIFMLLKYCAPNIDMTMIHGVKEGVENRISSLLDECDCWQGFWSKLTTKRYTDAYLLRTLTNVLLSNKYSANDLAQENINFVNVLAVAERSKDLLSAFNCDVATKSGHIPNDSLIHTADLLYSCLLGNFSNHMQIVKD